MSREVCVYRIGSQSGFYSEFNLMILTMLYCLEEGIEFKLYSDGANFAPERGWRQFFLPFCEEVHDSFHVKFNGRTKYIFPSRGRKYYYRNTAFILKYLDLLMRSIEDRYKKKYRVNYLTNDVLEKLKLRYAGSATDGMYFNFPKEKVFGDFQTVTRALIEKAYRFNDETQQAIDRWVDKISLPEKYVGFQIRGGDKYVETSLHSVDKYIKKAESLTNIRNAFISTDDYRLFTLATERYPDWKFLTLCDEQDVGYNHKEFMMKSFDERLENYYNLFACIEILRKSDLFVGTYSSNLGVFLGMCMEPDKCFAVDFDSFHFWWF